jgi:GH15 family glucan-1,4-alpha-glucosidase
MSGAPAAPAYLPIGDHGIIGDLHTAALVGRNGAIDWWCAPRFDAPSVFGALLDAGLGGHWTIAPRGPWTSEQRYLPATNILVTTFHTDSGGVAALTDFMPLPPARGVASEIHRRVNCTRGSVEVEVVFAPRFDYGAQAPLLVLRRNGVLATDVDDDVATLAAPTSITWQLEDGRAVAHLALQAGEAVWFALRYDDDEVHAIEYYASSDKLDATARWWDAWLAQLAYRGPYRQEVERSALVLKLCCYDPSGAIIGAPTTSLPESAGGDRNWDYRFVWLRDAAFVLYGLERLGFSSEVDAFLAFLKRVARRSDGRHLQIMYGVDGRRDLPEQVLAHLEGYRGARPVRVGNGAARQFQLDIYGELLETVALWYRRGHVTEGLWKVLRQLVDWTAAHWREPDYSIWEARQDPKHYVFSKVMAWAALDRGARIAERLQLPADLDVWRREAKAVHQEVLEKGWDAERGTFVQVYGEKQLDAAVLIVANIGFLRRDDPRVRSTLAAVRRELASPCEDLIYRYRSPDGLGGHEGAFVACSFWMVQNLALVGEFAEAERLFRNLLRRANPLGLLAEEIDPNSGEQLGNFPQALSHAALLGTAFILERLRPRDRSQDASPQQPSNAATPATG